MLDAVDLDNTGPRRAASYCTLVTALSLRRIQTFCLYRLRKCFGRANVIVYAI